MSKFITILFLLLAFMVNAQAQIDRLTSILNNQKSTSKAYVETFTDLGIQYWNDGTSTGI